MISNKILDNSSSDLSPLDQIIIFGKKSSLSFNGFQASDFVGQLILME